MSLLIKRLTAIYTVSVYVKLRANHDGVLTNCITDIISTLITVLFSPNLPHYSSHTVRLCRGMSLSILITISFFSVDRSLYKLNMNPLSVFLHPRSPTTRLITSLGQDACQLFISMFVHLSSIADPNCQVITSYLSYTLLAYPQLIIFIGFSSIDATLCKVYFI